MRVALCQVVAGSDKEQNLEKILRTIDDAADAGAEVVALPESIDYVGPRDQQVANAEDDGGPFAAALARKAAERSIWIVGGTTRINIAPGRVTNTLGVYGPSGVRVARYDKIHTFDVAIPGGVETRESSIVEGGSSIVVADVAGVASGLSVCFDVRFPELFRLLALAGAKLLFVPSAFAHFTGKDHWEVLLRARAIENQCFVIAANQSGNVIPTIPLFGNSMVVDPWGSVIARITEDEGTAIVDIDVGEVDRIRTQLPSLTNRRSDVYSLSATPRS
jgi:predicted amidohydrolase